MSLSQIDADILFAMDKIPETNESFYFPHSGDRLAIPFMSIDKREKFLVDIQRYSISINKVKYQNRARKSIPLRRLEINGSPHQNPETDNPPLPILSSFIGIDIPCPHVHIYFEGWGLKWALPASEYFDLSNKNIYEVMVIFFDYCNVKKNPIIENGLLL